MFLKMSDVKNITLSFLFGSFTIIIALSWNNVLNSIFDRYYPNPKKREIKDYLIYALAQTTLFLILVSLLLDKDSIDKFIPKTQ
jgi:uncharacterized membrane protein